MVKEKFGKTLKVSKYYDQDCSTTEKIEFRRTNYFRSIFVLVFALATALNKFHFRFRSLRKKRINFVLVIKYHINFRLQFDINKKAFSKVIQKS